MTIATPIEKWSGKVREVMLGATAAEGGSRGRTVTVGGESTLPFLQFEGQIPHPPLVALEVRSRRPADWSPLLLEAWGTALDDPAAWAGAAEAAGADLLLLTYTLEDTAARRAPGAAPGPGRYRAAPGRAGSRPGGEGQ